MLFLSRHEERKGLDVLIDALPTLPAQVRIWVASDGPDTARLKAAAAGDRRVEWLGRIDEEEKVRRLRGAHVLCAPSLRGESFGMILLEAMAAGTPVVAGDLPGYRNVIGSADPLRSTTPPGLLVPPEDPVALGSALRLVLDDPDLASSLSTAGDARAAHFSMDGLAEAYVEIYRSAITSASRRPT